VLACPVGSGSGFVEPVHPLVRWFRKQEQSVFAIMSGTRHIAAGYPNDLPSRASTGILKKPTVIDRAWETGRSATCKVKEKI
jgi:hypothetical protein